MSPKILYIEDDPLNRRLVHMILGRIGYRYLDSGTAKDGIRAAEIEQPDLILMDINLPDMDGYAARQLLANNPMTMSIPVIALTANIMHGDRGQALSAGFDGYLAKPVNKIIVRNLVERLIKTAQPSISA